MANRAGHRRFGYVRKLRSGRFSASFLTPDGTRQFAPETFRLKGEAAEWLSIAESELLKGDWSDPKLGEITVSEFGERWIKEHKVGRRTREEEESLFRLHIRPFLADRPIGSLDPAAIRTWRSELQSNGRSEDRTAKAYRLLRAILNTATDDGLIKRNPCRIKGAGQYRTPERAAATVVQAYNLAAAMPERFRVLVLAAALTGLRWGELIALRRCDLDLGASVVHVYRRLEEARNGEMTVGPPKSEAGARSIALPTVLVGDLLCHMARFAQAGPAGLVFTTDGGGPLRRGNFHRSTKWTATVAAIGLPSFHFHDLRHTANQLAAATGASTRELMHRMGHGSMRAALIYQHSSTERDAAIADGVSELVARGLPRDG